MLDKSVPIVYNSIEHKRYTTSEKKGNDTMMKYNNFRAMPKDVTNADPVAMFDLDYFYELTVITNGESHTVIDSENERMYAVDRPNAEAAVRAYLDWVFGEMPLYTYSQEEDGWELTDRTDWPAEYFDITLDYCPSWEQVEER